MDSASEVLARFCAGALVFGIFMALVCGVLLLIHTLLTLPMRRAERARLFLDVLETALNNGQPIEEALISVSQSHDLSMGVRFHLLTAWLEQNLRLGEGLARVRGFLPPQIAAMLRAGEKIGDLRKVFPACRQLLKDGVSQTRAAISYLVIITFIITPAGVWIFGVMQVVIVPRLLEISRSIDGNPAAAQFIYDHHRGMLVLQVGMLLALWFAAILYIGGPRVASWFPILDRFYYLLPWRRKRMQRDFSSLLAILLDSGVSEPEAVTLAADCSANSVFRRRAERAVFALQNGMKLTQAVEKMDDSGEFVWRLTNAFHGGGGFLKALAGWHESLDAKAFQQEQAAAHGITTGLVLWSGVFVGAVVISVFAFLVSVIDEGVTW